MKKIVFFLLGLSFALLLEAQDEGFRSPVEIKFSPDGKMLALTDFTNGSVYFIDAQSRNIKQEVQGLNQPFGLVWINNDELAVSEYGSHQIGLIDAKKHKLIQRIPCVKYPMGITLGATNHLLVTGFGKGELGIVDLKTSVQTSVVSVWYQPNFVATTPDGKIALVSNLTPKSSANGAKVSLVNLSGKNEVRNVELPFGSTNVRQVATSSDGKWGYVVHTYGKVMLPTSQIERGWVNTNVLSIIDIATGAVYATLPFDFISKGAADPWGLTLSADGSRLYASLAGVNELAVLKLDLLHKYLSGVSKPDGLRTSDANAEIAINVWDKIYKDPSQRKILADQFAALYAAGLLERYPLSVANPRGIALSPDGKSLVATGYYSGDIAWFDTEKNKVSGKLDLGNEPEITLDRKGEMIFHDGNSTFQGWLSCVSCHPAGRADGLNWDLLNDGIGSPKNAKSLLLAHATPPSMSTGIRANYEVAVKSGFHFIKFVDVNDETETAIKAYLSSMKPDPSPYLDDAGNLTPKAVRGKELFESEEVGCVKCHSGPYLTDQKMHNVGTKGKNDRTDSFDTPTLIEAWRTAPYLHDGSISKIEDLFAPDKAHTHKLGHTKHLTAEDLNCLIEYVKSL